MVKKSLNYHRLWPLLSYLSYSFYMFKISITESVFVLVLCWGYYTKIVTFSEIQPASLHHFLWRHHFHLSKNQKMSKSHNFNGSHKFIFAHFPPRRSRGRNNKWDRGGWRWCLHLCKVFFFSLRKNVTIFRGSRHCTLVAEQHANTQSFIRKADGSVIWYPSILVMVWVPGFLIHCSRAKMESMNLFDFVFQLFCIPK